MWTYHTDNFLKLKGKSLSQTLQFQKSTVNTTGPYAMCYIWDQKSVIVCGACDVWTSFPYHVVFPEEALEPNNQESLKWVHPQQAVPLSWHSLVSGKGSERSTWAEESSGKEIKDVKNKKKIKNTTLNSRKYTCPEISNLFTVQMNCNIMVPNAVFKNYPSLMFVWEKIFEVLPIDNCLPSVFIVFCINNQKHTYVL